MQDSLETEATTGKSGSPVLQRKMTMSENSTRGAMQKSKSSGNLKGAEKSKSKLKQSVSSPVCIVTKIYSRCPFIPSWSVHT